MQCAWLTLQYVRNHFPKNLYVHWWAYGKKIHFKEPFSTNGSVNDKIPTSKLAANEINIKNYVKL